MRPSDYCRLLLLSSIWGASFLLMRIVVPQLGIVATTFYRELLGALGLAVVLIASCAQWRFQGKFGLAMLLGVLNSAVPFLLYSVAARVLPSGYSAIINATTPLMGVVIGALFFSEKPTPAKAFGVVLGLSGVGVLTQTGPVEFSLAELLGAAACLLAVTCYGLSGFLTQRWISDRGGLDSKLLAFGSQFGAAALLVPVFAYTAVAEPVSLPETASMWGALLGLGLGCSTLAYILYFRLIADIGPVRSMSVTFLVPLFGVIFGALFLHEQLSLAHLFGGFLIAAALYLVLQPAKDTAMVLNSAPKERTQ